MGKTPEPLVALFLLFSLGLESVKGPRNDPVPSAQLPPHPRLGLSISSPPSSQKEPVFTCVSLIRLKGRGRFSRLVLPLDPVCTPPPTEEAHGSAGKCERASGSFYVRVMSEDGRLSPATGFVHSVFQGSCTLRGL